MVNAREWGRSLLKDTVSVWDDEKVLEVDGGEKEKKRTFSVKVLNSFMSPVDGHLD